MIEPIFSRSPQIVKGISYFLSTSIVSPYKDPLDLSSFVTRCESLFNSVTIYETELISNLRDGANILSIGEGTGELVISLARKYPNVNFYAFDITIERVEIATRLATHFSVSNVHFFVASVDAIPLKTGSVSGVIERGVFHILEPRLMLENLREIERVCRGPVVMGQMMLSAHWYLVQRWFRSRWNKNPRIYKNALETFQIMPKDFLTIWKLGRFVQKTIGRHVKYLYYFRGDEERGYSSKMSLLSAPVLCGFTYNMGEKK